VQKRIVQIKNNEEAAKTNKKPTSEMQNKRKNNTLHLPTKGGTKHFWHFGQQTQRGYRQMAYKDCCHNILSLEL